MLHQITWLTYFAVVAVCLVLYYAFVVVNWYGPEVRLLLGKSGSSQAAIPSTFGELLTEPVIGPAKPAPQAPEDDEPVFGPAEIPDEPIHTATNKDEDNELVSDFSEMISEIKTLIRVIADSNDSRENFEMLFRLEVEKFARIAGTPYQEKINQYLLK